MEYSILMPGAVVESGATVRYAIVAEKAHVCGGASVGTPPSENTTEDWGIAVVAAGVRVGKNATLGAKEMAGEDLPDQES